MTKGGRASDERQVTNGAQRPAAYPEVEHRPRAPKPAHPSARPAKPASAPRSSGVASRAWTRRVLGTGRTAALALGALALAACSPREAFVPGHRVRADDPEIAAAERRAAASLARFRAAFAKKDRTDSDWRFRARFDQNTEAGPLREDLWFVLESDEGDQFQGRLVNRPHHLKGLQQHERLAVPLTQITDWSFVRAGQLQGAYTIRVLYSRMSEEEKRTYCEHQLHPFAPDPQQR